uniref:Uncharacterized protein n=1 Tax=Anguilla anguilla TaxID=7936 RepID=A0A0E9W5K8_ANGAN
MRCWTSGVHILLAVLCVLKLILLNKGLGKLNGLREVFTFNCRLCLGIPFSQFHIQHGMAE